MAHKFHVSEQTMISSIEALENTFTSYKIAKKSVKQHHLFRNRRKHKRKCHCQACDCDKSVFREEWENHEFWKKKAQKFGFVFLKTMEASAKKYGKKHLL